MEYKLQFERGRIPGLAKNYQENPARFRNEKALEVEIEAVISPNVRRKGYFTKDEFLKVCEWKTPRTKPRCKRNEEYLIQEATRLALAASHERLKIEILRSLEGVNWPTASVLLHFGYREDRYPILDFRALESLGIEKPAVYDFEFWQAYCDICRELAKPHSMREFDRALWQFSKENSRKKG